MKLKTWQIIGLSGFLAGVIYIATILLALVIGITGIEREYAFMIATAVALWTVVATVAFSVELSEIS